MKEDDFHPGDVVDGKFRLVSLLGEGGMGRVFEARHLYLGRRVAIKLMRRELLRVDGAFQRLQQEALASSRIQHSNIVEVLDFGVDRDHETPYVVQEFLEGMTLKDHLATAPGGRLHPTEALTLMIPVMNALSAAHKHGVVHRDIKPANIFLARDERGRTTPKIIDFGVAKALNPLLHDAAETKTGQPIGTPAYMAREQAEGVVVVDARADVWAVGVVLYELLSGRWPYEGANANVIIGKVLFGDPAPLASHGVALEPALVSVIEGALQPDRERRYPTMRSFLSELLACTPVEVRSDAPPERPIELATTAPSKERVTRPDATSAPSVVLAMDTRERALLPSLETVQDGRADGVDATLTPATMSHAPVRSRPVRQAAVAVAVLVVVAAVAASVWRPAVPLVPSAHALRRPDVQRREANAAAPLEPPSAPPPTANADAHSAMVAADASADDLRPSEEQAMWHGRRRRRTGAGEPTVTALDAGLTDDVVEQAGGPLSRSGIYREF